MNWSFLSWDTDLPYGGKISVLETNKPSWKELTLFEIDFLLWLSLTKREKLLRFGKCNTRHFKKFNITLQSYNFFNLQLNDFKSAQAA